MRKNGIRLRLLYIYQHLLKYLDADHPSFTPELLRYPKEEHGMEVNRVLNGIQELFIRLLESEKSEHERI